jgi:DNA-binding CsgD family transcriptional regulator
VHLQPSQKFKLAAGDRVWLGGLELEVVGLTGGNEEEYIAVQPAQDGDTVELRRQKRTCASTDVVQQSRWQDLMGRLTPTELDIVLWMARGYSDPEDIAAQVNRSKHTIRTHYNNIFHKLGIHSRDELLSMIRRSEADLSGLPE